MAANEWSSERNNGLASVETGYLLELDGTISQALPFSVFDG
ncbi:MAG: hypothetical protein ACOCZB_01275 [Spirochaetota bacterium]